MRACTSSGLLTPSPLSPIASYKYILLLADSFYERIEGLSRNLIYLDENHCGADGAFFWLPTQTEWWNATFVTRINIVVHEFASCLASLSLASDMFWFMHVKTQFDGLWGQARIVNEGGSASDYRGVFTHVNLIKLRNLPKNIIETR